MRPFVLLIVPLAFLIAVVIAQSPGHGSASAVATNGANATNGNGKAVGTLAAGDATRPGSGNAAVNPAVEAPVRPVSLLASGARAADLPSQPPTDSSPIAEPAALLLAGAGLMAVALATQAFRRRRQ